MQTEFHFCRITSYRIVVLFTYLDTQAMNRNQTLFLLSFFLPKPDRNTCSMCSKYILKGVNPNKPSMMSPKKLGEKSVFLSALVVVHFIFLAKRAQQQQWFLIIYQMEREDSSYNIAPPPLLPPRQRLYPS